MTDTAVIARPAHSYPAGSVELRMAPDGRPLLIRPTTAKDAELLQDFVRGLSVASRYQRFQGAIRELAPEVLRNLLSVDYRRSMAFVAILFEHGHRRMIGEARYAPALDGSGAADFALAVADGWQRQGIGRLLFDRLLRYAEGAGITRIQGDVLHGNTGMLGLARQSGFALRAHPDGAWLTRVERELGALPLAAWDQAGTASFQSSLPPA
jgi:acetyltransferase